MEYLIEKQLSDLQLISRDKVFEYYPRVRDKEGIRVLKCAQSGVIYLSGNEHLKTTYYNDKKGTTYWSSESREEGIKVTSIDDQRRFEQFKEMVIGASYLDIGTGMGGILDRFRLVASRVCAVEPQNEIRKILDNLGYTVFDSIESAPKEGSDVVSLFHVFEHLIDPLGSLKSIHSLLKTGGKIIIEVPHARDALLETFDLESFKRVTFFSEHLILHTRTSLSRFLGAAGFKNIAVMGYQRYPLANHLYWLSKGLPGGHTNLTQFRNTALDNEYSSALNAVDQTDTLIAIAEK